MRFYGNTISALQLVSLECSESYELNHVTAVSYNVLRIVIS